MSKKSDSRKIRRLRDLPRHFDLSKYRALESYGAAEWLWVQEVRSSFWAVASGNLNSEDKEWMKESIEDLLKTPLDDSIKVVEAAHDKSRLRVGPIASFTVWHATQVGQLLSTMPDEKQKILKSKSRDFFLKKSELESTPLFLALDQAKVGEFPVLRILTADMRYPDSHLVACFKVWLSEIRKLEPTKQSQRALSDADFRRWTMNKLAPYCDLAIWAKIHGTAITKACLGDALLLDSEVDRSEKIRKVVEPEAKRWLSRATTEQLQNASSASRRVLDWNSGEEAEIPE